MPSLSSASTTSGPPPPHDALLPRPAIPAPTTQPGAVPASTRTVASSADVVVLPWVPATAATWRCAPMAARAPERWSTGTPCARAATTSTSSSGVAVDTTTASASAGSVVGPEPVVTSTPRARSGARNGVSSAGSWPLTRWPISARSVATALIPAPPTLVTWMRRGVERSIVTVGRVSHARSSASAAIDAAASGRAHASRGGGHLGAAVVVGEEPIDLGREPGPVELGVGHQHRGTGVDQAPGVVRLLIGGDEGRRHEHRREAHGGQLEAGARTGTTHRQVGGRERRRHVVLVPDGAGTRGDRGRSAPPRRWRPSPALPPRGGR